MAVQSAETAHIATEYAIVTGHGLFVLHGPTSHARWNEVMTLAEAAERWYPGGVVMTRTVTTFEPIVGDWEPTKPPTRDRA